MKILIVNDASSPATGLRPIADSAWRPDRRPLFPAADNKGFQLRPAIRISRLGKGIAAKFAARYYDAFVPALVDSRAADPAGPAAACIADDAVMLGPWIPIADADGAVLTLPDGTTAPAAVEPAAIDAIIAAMPADVTFKTGDVIILPHTYTIIHPVPGDTVCVKLNGAVALQFNTR